MTASTSTDRPRDLAALDRHIVRALAALRLARTATRQARSPQALASEERAEKRLNALLDYRLSVQGRAARLRGADLRPG